MRSSNLAAVVTCRSSCPPRVQGCPEPRAHGAGAECAARPSGSPSTAVKAWTSPGQSPAVALAPPCSSGFPILSASPSVAFLHDTMSAHPHGPHGPHEAPLPQTFTASPGHRAHQGHSPLCIPTRPADGADTEAPRCGPLGTTLFLDHGDDQDAGGVVHGDTQQRLAHCHSTFSSGARVFCSLPRDRVLPEGSVVSLIAAPGAARLETLRQTG